MPESPQPRARLVSACLTGEPCRFDGRARTDARFARDGPGTLVPICPEVLGGLPTPRRPAEIVGGDGDDVLDGRARVVDDTGRDVTDAFVAGAYRSLATAQTAGAAEAVLVDRSPSCGSAEIYDGAFAGRRRPGQGVTAALLRRYGIRVEVPRP